MTAFLNIFKHNVCILIVDIYVDLYDVFFDLYIHVAQCCCGIISFLGNALCCKSDTVDTNPASSEVHYMQ